MKKIFILGSLLTSFFSYGYEDTFYKAIQQSDNDKILIDIISHDKDNPSRHFNFAKKITEDFPEITFRFGFHKHATFYTLKNEEFENQKEKLKNNNSKYSIDFNSNDFSILDDLNGELYVCKSGAAKRLLDIEDINPIFNSQYSSAEINAKSRKEGFLILKEKSLNKIKKIIEEKNND